MEAVPARDLPAAQPGRALGRHHHRPHVAQGLRPHHVDLQAGELPDEGSGRRHVRHEEQLQLRQYGRGRHGPARHRGAARGPVPGPHRTGGEEPMTAIPAPTAAAEVLRRRPGTTPTAVVPPGAKRFGVARTLRYLLLLFFLYLIHIPVYVLVVTSFKGPGDASPDRAWTWPQAWTVDNWRAAWTTLSPAILRTVQMVVPAAIISSFIEPR